MTSPRVEKIQMKATILQVLERDDGANYNVLISSLKLETGFSDKIVKDLVQDMHNVGMIEQFDHLISGAIEENSFVANPIMWLKARIKGVGDVFLYSERITLLDNKDRLEITKYLFEVENGGERARKKNV